MTLVTSFMAGSAAIVMACLVQAHTSVRLPRDGTVHERSFLAENEKAMDRMMVGMRIMPTGDIDRDFTSMMIAHHQGAIEMAQAELRHGRNKHLRRIAQGIVIEQEQEIAAMRVAVNGRTSDDIPEQRSE